MKSCSASFHYPAALVLLACIADAQSAGAMDLYSSSRKETVFGRQPAVELGFDWMRHLRYGAVVSLELSF